jgi:thiol-disulfide isomerase/thioredoxin
MRTSRLPKRWTTSWQIGILIAGFLFAGPALARQSAGDDSSLPAGESEVTVQSSKDKPAQSGYGMRAPRPVNSTEREFRGFPPPRQPAAILNDIGALDARMQQAGDDPSTWRAVQMHNNEVKHDRINLISELEESGYEGTRLMELLQQKLQDIRDVWSRQYAPLDSYNALRKEIAERHKGTDLGMEAEAEIWLEVVQFTTINGLRVHPDDYEKLAAVELKRKNSELGGLLLLEALHVDKDPELRRKWHDWMITNLGPQALGRRYAQRERTFGHAITLEGEGLDGSKIDTGAWAGDVILVDFWGTWCIPCKEAMPELKRLDEKYRSRGLRIVGVLSDYQLEKAAQWLEAKGFSWPQIVDRSLTRENVEQHRIAVQYAVGGFPTLWIIDRQGILREEGDRENLEEQVLRFLDEPKPPVR